MSDKAQKIVERFNNARNRRANYDILWQELSERVAPNLASITTQRSPGQKKQELVFDTTATNALKRYVAIQTSMIVPSQEKWHTVGTGDIEVDREFDWYFQQVRDVLFKIRYSSKSTFSTSALDVFRNCGLFGSSPFLVHDDSANGRILYRALPIKEMYVDANPFNEIDTYYRLYELNSEDAKKEFGEENLSETVRTNTDTNKKFEFIHYITPNKDIDFSRKDKRGKKLASFDVELVNAHIVREGGFDTSPYSYPRADVYSDDFYGYSPAMECFPDIKSANAMRRTALRVGEQMGDTTWLATSDEDIINPSKINKANEIVYGGLNEDGKPNILPAQQPGNIPVTLEMEQQSREVIKDMFNTNLFQLLKDNPQMTATQSMIMAKEQGILLAPMATRYYKEWLSPLIMREIDIAEKNRWLPPMPEELKDVLSVRNLKIIFESPMIRAQEAGELQAMNSMIEDLAIIGQFAPEVGQIPDWEKVLRERARLTGLPFDLLKSEEEMQAIRDKQAQDIQQAQAIESAEAVGNTMKDVSQANKNNANAGAITNI